jgi:aspartyl-tRNA(Asn)/glutamyl-tRNA(Gln) amidotransferase subunit C
MSPFFSLHGRFAAETIAREDKKVSISDQEIQHIAGLVKLSFEPEQIAVFARQLTQILDYMQQLNQLDTSRVAPTYHMAQHKARLREDIAETGLNIEQVLSNAPEHDNRNFIVPKII